MIENKKYNVFENKNKRITEVYPELSFMINGQYFENESGVTLDKIQRYVIYYYDRKCELHSQNLTVEKSRETALFKFDIPRKVFDSEDFFKIECEIASRYMLYRRDNEFDAFVTLNITQHKISKKLKLIPEDSTFQDYKIAIQSTPDLLSLVDTIANMSKTLFGDMEHIERYKVQQEINNMFKAETAMQ